MANPAVQDFSTLNAVTDYLTKSYAGSLLRYAPNGMAPIFGLTNMMNTGTALSVEHGYFSKTMLFPQTTVGAGGATNVATNIPVASSANFLPGDMLMNFSTNEVVRVTAIVDATNITVTRAVGTQAAAAMTSGQKLYAIGNAHEQGSYRPKSRVLAIARVMNFTQIFRNGWSLAHTLAVIKPIVGGDNIAESKIDCGLFHAADIEKAILWGQKFSGMYNNQYITTMDGIWSTLKQLAPSNVQAAGATTNYTQLQAMLDYGFNTITNGRNGNERTIFVGGQARSVINDIGRLNGTYQIVDGQTNFGLQFSTFKTARGTFRMIEHPMLNTNPDWAKCAFSLDLPSIKIMYLTGRKTMSEEYNAAGRMVEDGVDAVGGSLTTEMTMEITNPSAHVIITGLTAAAQG